MNGFLAWCIVASAIVGYLNFAYLAIINDKLREIKREISKKKGGE